jgi:ribonuclease-3
MDPNTIAAVESALGYTFIDKSLLIRALTSKSYAQEQRQRGQACTDQEIFRIWGDAILKEALVALLIQQGYDTRDAITDKKRSLESRDNLGRFPQAVAIAPHMRLGNGDQKKKINQQPNTIAETFEAVIAAIYQDGGHTLTRELIGRWFAEAL